MRLFRKKLLAGLVIFCMSVSMLLGSAPGTLSAYALSGGLSDVQNHWAAAQIGEWVDRGIVKGYADGTFKPDNSVTRAEFVAMVNRTFGYAGTSSGNFPDVRSTDWFANDVNKARTAGYIQGTNDGKFLPNNRISRQEAAVILCRILELKSGGSGAANIFSDGGSFPAWSKDYISAITAGGYMKGYADKSFRPDAYITRAESVVILSRAAGALYSVTGDYGSGGKTQEISGNATITASGVNLTNTVIRGNLYLTEGIGNGEVTLDNVTVKGKVFVRGGGPNSIKIKNSQLGQIIVEKKDGIIRIVCMGNTSVGEVDLKSGAKLEESELTGDGFENVTVDIDIPAGSTVQLVGDFEDCTIDSPVTVQISGGTVNNLTVAESAPGTRITGNGRIGTANINAVNVTIEMTPDVVNVKDGITAVVGGRTVTGGSPAATGGSGSNGGNHPPKMVVDGRDNDWKGIAPLEYGVGDVESVSAKIADGKLYVMIKGSGVGNAETGYLEMDTDMSSSSGYISFNWADCGIDFMLMKEFNEETQEYEMNLYSHPTNNSDWDWTYVATANDKGSPAEYGATDDIVEMSIDVTALNYNQRTLGLAYMVDDYNLVPEKEYGLVEVVGPKEPPETPFEGSLTDWDGVSPIATGTGFVTKLYAKQDEDTLYMRAVGKSHLSKVPSFFIDSDSNPATGYNSANWLNAGIEYMVTDDVLYRYNGDGGSWSWAEVGKVLTSRGATASEAAIDLSDMGLAGPSNIKVSFYLQGGSLAPAKGATMARLTVENPTPAPFITIDGDVNDWDGFNAKELASFTDEKEGNLFAVQDNTYLYVLAKGTALSGQNYLLIDSDNDAGTGFINGNWNNGDTGIDYLVDINTGASLCAFSGSTRGDWNWPSVSGSVVVINKTDTQVELSIKLSDMGLNGTTGFKLGFWANGGNYLLPAYGTPLGVVAPATTYVPSPGITADGNSSEWDKGATLVAQSVMGAVYGAQDSEYLYLLAEGTGLTNEHYFYLDTDMDSGTGFSSAIWQNPVAGAADTRTGIDYFVAPGDIEHQTTHGGWGFGATGYAPEIATNLDDTVVEERIRLSDLGLSGPTTMRIGYRGNDDAYAIPASGPLTSVLTAPTPEIQPLDIEIDGDIADWTGIEALDDSYSITYSAYAIQDNEYLYMYASGARFDRGQTFFFIDSDSNSSTGLASGNWDSAGADYIVDNSSLYKHVDSNPDDRTNWEWNLVEGATVEIAKTENVTEMRVKLTDLGLTGPSDLKLSYWGNAGTVLLPVLGSSMATLSDAYRLPNGLVPKFDKIPNAIGLAIDDTGWMGGSALWNSENDPELPPDGPGRLCVDRDPQLSDYKTLVDIGEAVNSRLMTAFILSEFDKNKTLAQSKYNTEDFNITEYSKNWTNSDYAGTAAKDEKLDNFAKYFYDNASYMEFGMHGIRHARFANEPVEGGGTRIIQSDAEWGPVTDVYVSKVPYTKTELELKAQAFMDILRQYFTPDQSSFPKSMVPPRHGWVHTSRNDPATGNPYTFTTGEVVNEFGVKYVNGDANIDTNLGDGGIDNGVLFMNRQYGADFYAIGKTPKNIPMAYGKLGWVESHFPNLWDAKDQWINYLNTINDHPYRYLPRNTEQLSSQWLYMKYATIEGNGDGMTFTVDTTGMPQGVYDYDLLGTLVLKTPLQGKHITSASITGGVAPQITGYYEDGFGYGYLEIADGANTMGRLDKGIYTLTCTIGDGYMDSYVDFTKGTFNVYSFDCQSNSATIQLEMYGTQDVKIKLPFEPTQKPESDNGNLIINSWNYEDGYLIMNVTGVDMQGEVGTITIN